MKGLAALAALEHARLKEQSARFCRAHANKYSTEHKEYQDGMRHARKLEQDAAYLRRKATPRNNNPYDLSG